MVNFHLPGALGEEQAKFGFQVSWSVDADSISVKVLNNGVPEPYIIFAMRTWLKRYEEEQENDFSEAFYGDKGEE